MNKKKKKGIRRLLEIAGEKKGLVITSCVISVISAVFMLVPYLNIYFILKELLEKGLDISKIDGQFLIKQGYIALVSLVLGLITLYCSLMASHIAAFNILYSIRMRLAKHIGTLPLGYLSNTSIGIVKKTLEQNVEKIELFVAHKIPDLINVMATAVIMVGALLYLSFPLAISCIASFIIGMIIQTSMWFGEKSKKYVRGYYDALEQVNESAVQYVRGMQVVKIFGKTVHSFKRFYDDMKAYRDYSVQFTDMFQRGFIMFKVLSSSFFTFMLPVGIFLLNKNPQSIAFGLTFLFFVVMAPGAAAPMFKLTLLASSTMDINEGVGRIDSILSQQPVPDPKCPMTPEKYHVEFKDVSFSYSENNISTRNLAIEDVSFIAREDEVTALVGPSGSGKSTIANLIPRFWDIERGEILIGGVNIKDIPIEKLMNIMSFVFQDNFLFFDSIYENIRVGRPDATKDEIFEAAKASQCHDFIMNLPKGYDTLIGEDGVFLSGGEEQRICIARAILKNAPILVLDEATAFADPENEYEIQLALNELIKSKTVIVIAHRLSSIKNANKILVMEKGKLIEQGKHESLINIKGLYSRMWEAYNGASSWKLKREVVS